MPTAVCIGNFDGVHVGHEAITRAARRLVGREGRVVAMAFDPHPISVLRPSLSPARLTTFETRAALLRKAGADEVIRLEPTASLLQQEPDEFLHAVVSRHGATHVVEGHDFRFGRGARGNPRTLGILCEAWGLATEIVAPVEVDLADQHIARASSSLVRTLVGAGRVQDAIRVLGRPYSVDGEVVRGDQRGRTIGFPTANVAATTMLPGDGVYAALATLPCGTTHAAAVNVGARPTFAGVERRIEAHVITAAPPAGYGWRLRLEFLAWVRDQVRFDGPERLVRQLASDAARAAAFARAVTG
ncbi:MAG: riboflavin kinase [Phycisphaerae bacterium]